MKKLFILFLLISYSNAFGQEKFTEKPNKLEYKSFSISPLQIYWDNETGGLSFSADLSYTFKENIFTISGSFGGEFEINIFGDAQPDSYQQLNVLYGKELSISRVAFLDIHAGAGYFSLKSPRIDLENRGYERKSTIGIPIAAKLRFKTGKRFSLGFQFQMNINSVKNIYTTGIVLQWNKN